MSGPDDFPLILPGPGDGAEIETNIFDIEEIYHDGNRTIQVLRNSITGEVSVGWWPRGRFPELEGDQTE